MATLESHSFDVMAIVRSILHGYAVNSVLSNLWPNVRSALQVTFSVAPDLGYLNPLNFTTTACYDRGGISRSWPKRIIPKPVIIANRAFPSRPENPTLVVATLLMLRTSDSSEFH
jgi:hypothetical protein